MGKDMIARNDEETTASMYRRPSSQLVSHFELTRSRSDFIIKCKSCATRIWGKKNISPVKRELEQIQMKTLTWWSKLSSIIAGAPKLFPTSIKVGNPPVVRPWRPYKEGKFELKIWFFARKMDYFPKKKKKVKKSGSLKH